MRDVITHAVADGATSRTTASANSRRRTGLILVRCLMSRPTQIKEMGGPKTENLRNERTETSGRFLADAKREREPKNDKKDRPFVEKPQANDESKQTGKKLFELEAAAGRERGVLPYGWVPFPRWVSNCLVSFSRESERGIKAFAAMKTLPGPTN